MLPATSLWVWRLAPDGLLGSRQFFDDLFVDHCRSFTCPFLFSHRAIADDVPADHVLELLAVTPVLRVAVFEPENSGSDIGNDVFTTSILRR
jgi:hypothetical protein